MTMHPIEVLVTEHLLIEQVLNCLERMAEERALNGKLVNDAITFFRTFVHGWHFPREEAYLTCALDLEDTSEMEEPHFHDHRRCDVHLSEMEDAAAGGSAEERQAVERFGEHARAYIAILMKHIEDEEDRVFPAVERAPADEQALEAAQTFWRAESMILDRHALKGCVDAAHRLADHFNVPKAAVRDGGNPMS